MNTFRLDERFVGSAGVAQDVGGVGLVLGRLERGLRHIAGPGWRLPDLLSGGQKSLLHETLSLASVIIVILTAPATVAPRPAGRGEGRGRVGLVRGGVGGALVVTERGLGPSLPPGTLTPPPPLGGVLRLAPHPPERRRGRLGPLPVGGLVSGGVSRPAVPRDRVEPPGG